MELRRRRPDCRRAPLLRRFLWGAYGGRPSCFLGYRLARSGGRSGNSGRTPSGPPSRTPATSRAVLAGQLSRSLQSIDNVLLEIKDPSKNLDIDRSLDFGAAFNRRSLFRSLVRYRHRLPQVFNIAIADERGQVLVSTAAWPTPDVNVADRDYFNGARARSDNGLSTSVPIDNRINRTRTIVFARRLEGPSGNFLGIVYASVNSKYLEDIYGSTQSVRCSPWSGRTGRSCFAIRMRAVPRAGSFRRNRLGSTP
jgi:hypothetical protein